MNKSELIDKFKTQHEKLIKLVDKFPINKREERIFDRWNLNDVLAHIAGWNNQDILRFEAINEKTDLRKFWVDDLDAFNAEIVTKAKTFLPETIYSSFVDSGFDLIKTAQALPEDK